MIDVDQSDDMNKTLSAKIDIYDSESLTIRDNVTNSIENDYVVIHSKEQESSILNEKYQFIGITSDSHTISIKNRNTTSIKKTTLDVSKGTPSVSNSKIVYDKEKNIADMNINISGSSVTLNVIKIQTDNDTVSPDNAVIIFNYENSQITDIISAEIIQNDNEELDVTNSKWLINKQSIELKDKQGYTWTNFQTNPEIINITQTIPGLYYLHVLSVDSNKNQKETIKSINIFPNYDESLNDSTTIVESGTIWTSGTGTLSSPMEI